MGLIRDVYNSIQYMYIWKAIMRPKIQLSPVDIFFLYFDHEVIVMLVDYSNRYANSYNHEGNIRANEIWCFLLYGGYICF